MAVFTIEVNGERHQVDVDADTPLLWVLRDAVHLRGTKFGCGIGQCGACTVHLDGAAVRSCSVSVSQVGGVKITTIEGVEGKEVDALKTAWKHFDVPQCGYCQAGQLMNASAMLVQNSSPTDAEILRTMNGNLCRCGTYNRIKNAIKMASDQL